MKLQSAPSKKDISWTSVCLERVPFYRELTKRKRKMQVTTVGVRFSNVCVLEVFVKIVDCTHLFLMVQHIHFDLPSVV